MPYQPAAPGPAASGGNWPAPGPGGAAGHELRWRLVLSDTAKRLIGLFLGLGVLGLIAYIVIIVVVASGGVSTEVTRQNAINSVQSDNATLSKTLTPLASKTAACQSSQDPLHCITALDRNVGRAFHTFADERPDHGDAHRVGHGRGQPSWPARRTRPATCSRSWARPRRPSSISRS